MTKTFHLAQVNIARMLAPLDDPLLSEFVARLDDINSLADDSPGFVWRLQTEAGDATSLRPYADDRILFNMSVWRSPEDLRDFVYRSAHSKVMLKRRQWFARFQSVYYALWWVPAGHVPSIEEAKERLEYLRKNGEGFYAFSFARVFPAPGALTASPMAKLPSPKNNYSAEH
jgi:hypothetical protein